MDLESNACSALQYSFALADRFHASIDVVHACSARRSLPFESIRAATTGLLSEQRLRERLEKLLSGVPSGIPGRATAHIIDGPPLPALLTHLRRTKYELVVVGSGRLRNEMSVFPPGVGQALAHHSNCAVLSLCEARGPASPLSIGRILLAVDFSETTEVAIDWTAALVRHFGASLRLLHVRDAVRSRSPVFDLDRRRDERGEGERLEEVQRRFAVRGVAVEFAALSEGAVADCVVEHAVTAACDLIVLGAHSRRGALEAAIHGVVADVRRRSRVPVLSVRKSRAEALFASPGYPDPAGHVRERTSHAVGAREVRRAS